MLSLWCLAAASSLLLLSGVSAAAVTVAADDDDDFFEDVTTTFDPLLYDEPLQPLTTSAPASRISNSVSPAGGNFQQIILDGQCSRNATGREFEINYHFSFPLVKFGVAVEPLVNLGFEIGVKDENVRNLTSSLEVIRLEIARQKKELDYYLKLSKEYDNLVTRRKKLLGNIDLKKNETTDHRKTLVVVQGRIKDLITFEIPQTNKIYSDARVDVLRQSNFVQYPRFSRLSRYKLHSYQRNWTDAKDICDVENSHLLVPNNEMEAEVVTEILSNAGPFNRIYNNKNAWIGIHRLESEFQAVTNEHPFIKWRAGRPGSAKSCVSAFDDGTQLDERCEQERSFICEKS